jgi:putative DNA primase/helicase
MDVICELFATFSRRFVSSVDESAVVAATMQTVLRRVLPHALIVAAMANTPASGKTKLVQMMSIIATGRRAAVVTYTRDQVELEKHMGACAMAGDPLILYDNIDVPVRSPFLCGLTTSHRASFRILGTSERVTLPSNFAIALTGNNLSLVGDITQRVLPIRLDPRCEHPERESFPRDAEQYAVTQRAAVVGAVLTLVRAYQAAGNPDVGIPPHRDYAVWDRMIRAPIVWLGFPDPLSGLPGLKEDDPELAEIDALLTAWSAWWPETPQTLAEAVRIARQAERTDLIDAMTGMLGDKRLEARALGYALRRWRDRWVRGRRFVVDTTDKNVGHRWTVQCLG